MTYIEAPAPFKTLSVFLAGGITDCPNWQGIAAEYFQNRSPRLTVLNPRRADFPIGDPDAAVAQITWEHHALRAADAILFWFPCESICPIVLYELGAWSMTPKPIFVGTHPDYSRKQDVLIQTSLARPEVLVVHSLDELLRQVCRWKNDAAGP